jgi:tRNA threonylcarbamoyladenosine biosynthesis protein TsaE
MQTHTTKNEDETLALAGEFAKTLKGGEVIELVGDLGSGKTTFVRGIVVALGSSVRVKSPTFTILNEYPVNHESIKRIVHIDLYRFKDASELEALALDDYRCDDTVILIEWPRILGESIFKEVKEVDFEFMDESTRSISM